MSLVRHRTDHAIGDDYSSLRLNQEKNLKSTHAAGALMFFAVTVLAGCSSNGPRKTPDAYVSSSQADTSRYGAIESIQAIRSANTTTGAGAVAGGLVGGLLGNQVGGGSGKTVATVAGAVGGALVGNTLERSRSAQPEMYEIRVRLDSGDIATVRQESIYEMHPGNRVRVADGRVYRY